MPIVYRKTAQGVAEIETRAHRLAPRVRQMLILVDGRRSDADLRQLIAPGADEALHALAAGGFVELVGATAAPAGATPVRAAPPAGPTAATPAAPASVPATVASPAAEPASAASGFSAQDRRDAVRMLTDLVGPVGEPLALKIEQARGDDELRKLFDLAYQSIRNTRGSFAAAAFADRFRSRAAS
ncbi:MAG: hypothetical protein MUC32_05880 [Burkholderiaceae bacterium]|nr:hypothetical protein [Burkholderiaceae bacterium]